jgi:hypothetical protein
MRKVSLIFLYMLLLYPSLSWGVLRKEINTTSPLKCTFSKRDHNRIVVEEGVIEKIIYPEGYFSLDSEMGSGQAFMLPLFDFEEEVTISVITGGGYVQDMRVSLEDKSTEVILLKEPNKNSIDDLTIKPMQNEKDEFVSTLKNVLNGKIPDGYTLRNFKKEAKQEISGSKFKKLNKYILEGRSGQIRVIEVSHSKPKVQILSEKIFSADNVQWVYLQKPKVKPNESVFVIIGETKDVV